ncbi:hypothetical protein TR2A62_1560 [Thalassobium sp. R2A62]|jgi:hypothetical protein|nr:hypothetical protein TR2A62_1560 [Thalassobium sp. R2A62]
MNPSGERGTSDIRGFVQQSPSALENVFEDYAHPIYPNVPL